MTRPTKTSLRSLLLGGLAAFALAGPAAGHEIKAEAGNAAAPFDVVEAKVTAEERWLTFRMAVAGAAGASRPAPRGELAGSSVFAYVWPTSLDPETVGFEKKAGILAMTVTAHPDFDDTPLFDENDDGDLGNDGNIWHSHWVVLVPDETCGPDALKVKDIAEGATPRLPATWPGLPILIDSPGYSPLIDGKTVTLRVPFPDPAAQRGVSFDAVTAGLRVNASLHDPLLCVADVFDVGSGDLSLPGKVE